MPGFGVRLLISAIGLWIASAVVPGVQITGVLTLLIGALLLGVVNAIVRPVLVLLTLPITIVTLGLFLLVINAAMLGLVALLLDQFAVQGFVSAMVGALIVSMTSWLGSWYIGPSGRVEILVVRRGPY